MGEDELVVKAGRIQMARGEKKSMCTLQNDDIDKTTPFNIGEYTARRVIYLYTALTREIQKRCCMMYRATLHKPELTHFCLLWGVGAYLAMATPNTQPPTIDQKPIHPASTC